MESENKKKRFAPAQSNEKSWPKGMLLALIILCLPAAIPGAQQPLRTSDLGRQSPSWYAVIGGEAVSPCVGTSYGFALLSDGRLLSACTDTGTVIWQKRVKGRPSPFVSSFGDFLYVVTDRSHINFVNPSGATLWTAVCPFAITDSPLPGRDGRVFVRGDSALACYGLNGARKWRVTTEPLGDLPLAELDDGSILAFLKAPKDNCTVASRFSPFGEKIEDVTFTGIVSAARTVGSGVLVSLKNGSLGLVTAEGGAADSKWVNGSGNTAGAFAICRSSATGNSAFFFQNGSRTEAVIVRTDTGDILSRFQVGSIASKDFRIARETRDGFFISGSYSACEFKEDGTILYAATLPPSSKWSSIFYTDRSYIVLCMKDWTMNAYLMRPEEKSPAPRGKSGTAAGISYIPGAGGNSTDFGGRPLSGQKMAEISEAFEKGDCGEKEREYLSLLKAEAADYIASNATAAAVRGSQDGSYFSADADYTQSLIHLLSKTGTREFSVLIARILSGESDDSQLLTLIKSAGDTGYDENGEILLALETLLMRRIRTSDTVLLKAVCDATYKICCFMGRPALISRGKDILTYMLGPQYDKGTSAYARRTLEKMIAVDRKK